jgi:hypothetical protein
MEPAMFFKTRKPLPVSTPAAAARGPVPLSATEMRQVVGGSPKGTWLETSSPKGTWASPKGTW